MAKKASKLVQVVAACAVVGLAILVLEGGADSAGVLDDVGYYKSDDRQRVMSFRSPAGLDPSAVEEVMQGLPWTEGKLTVAVIYVGEDALVPADGLTLADGIQEALVLISNPPFDQWQYRLTINAAGQRSVKAR